MALPPCGRWETHRLTTASSAPATPVSRSKAGRHSQHSSRCTGLSTASTAASRQGCARQAASSPPLRHPPLPRAARAGTCAAPATWPHAARCGPEGGSDWEAFCGTHRPVMVGQNHTKSGCGARMALSRDEQPTTASGCPTHTTSCPCKTTHQPGHSLPHLESYCKLGIRLQAVLAVGTELQQGCSGGLHGWHEWGACRAMRVAHARRLQRALLVASKQIKEPQLCETLKPLSPGTSPGRSAVGCDGLQGRAGTTGVGPRCAEAFMRVQGHVWESRENNAHKSGPRRLQPCDSIPYSTKAVQRCTQQRPAHCTGPRRPPSCAAAPRCPPRRCT